MNKIDELAGKIMRDVFEKQRMVYPVNGIALKRHRVALGISRKEFAKLCEWPTVFQQGIEEPHTSARFLSGSQHDKIVAALYTGLIRRKT